MGEPAKKFSDEMHLPSETEATSSRKKTVGCIFDNEMKSIESIVQDIFTECHIDMAKTKEYKMLQQTFQNLRNATIAKFGSYRHKTGRHYAQHIKDKDNYASSTS